MAGRCHTLLGHQPYKNYQPHLFRFAALPCEVTFVLKFHFFVIQNSRKTTTLKHEVQSNLQVYELPIDVSQKRCSKCLPSARTQAVRRRRHWRIAATVIEWSILAHSVCRRIWRPQLGWNELRCLSG